MNKRFFLITVLCCVFFFSNCAIHYAIQENKGNKGQVKNGDKGGRSEITPTPVLKRMGYSVQVGAFSVIDNAVRLQNRLRSQGIEAYYYKHPTGLFKVLFGNFVTKSSAKSMASYLRSKSVISAYYIISPENSAVAKVKTKGISYLRKQLVDIAHRYIGVPYKWGGTSARSGFDCSGLTLTVYRQNGLRLPRNAAAQYRAGKRITRKALQPGDLVFFATAGGRSISHVGIYIGNGKFIHAPSSGRRVRIAKLGTRYWRRTYVGACVYI